MDEEKKENKPNNQQQEHWGNFILPVLIIAGLVGIMAIMADDPVRGYTPLIPEESWLQTVVGYLVIAVELFTAFIITTSLLRATISYARHLLDPINRQINYTERIRLRLGHMLNLGLEFAIGSDILRLSVTPSTQDMIILFTKVLLRILLNYFLDREIKASEELCGPGNYVPPLLEDDKD